MEQDGITHLESVASAFFFKVRRTFVKASLSNNIKIHYFEIGGIPVCIKFLNATIEKEILPALVHIAIPSTTPELTIYLGDSTSSDLKMPPPPWKEDAYLARSEIKDFNNEKYQFGYDVWGGTLHLLDKQNNIGFFWTNDITKLPIYEKGSPLRMLLNWWLHNKNRQFLHAGAIGNEHGGIILVGKSGSGKSTTSLACLHSPLLYASDDYCLVHYADKPAIYSIYNTAKLVKRQLDRNFAESLSSMEDRDDSDKEKTLLFLHPTFSHKLIRSFPLKAIFIPMITGKKETFLKPASKLEALKALAPSTIMQLANMERKAFTNMATFVKQVPTFHLMLGTELQEIPKIISQALDKLCNPLEK